LGLALAAAVTRWGAPLAASAALWIVAAANAVGWPSALIGVASLGGISSEMLLGHWFLVDPKLPRWPLLRLAYFGIAGIAAEGLRVLLLEDEFLIAAPVILGLLAGLGTLLMVGVVLSLRVRSYTGVMAATGFSYLATITALAVAIISRPA
jgi:hypothetical protein